MMMMVMMTYILLIHANFVAQGVDLYNLYTHYTLSQFHTHSCHLVSVRVLFIISYVSQEQNVNVMLLYSVSVYMISTQVYTSASMVAIKH